MPSIRYLRVGFDQNLFAYDIPKFRASVIEKTERVSSLYHNHKSDIEVIYRYPLIQYKTIGGKASIVCLEDGTNDIHHLLQANNLDFQIGRFCKSFSIDEISFVKKDVEVVEQPQSYLLKNWIALNQNIYPKYHALNNDRIKQRDLLEGILRGNILSFAKGLNWWIKERVEVKIIEILSANPTPIYKNKKAAIAFNIKFESNVILPDFIGLGKRTSVGFGIVTSTK